MNWWQQELLIGGVLVIFPILVALIETALDAALSERPK